MIRAVVFSFLAIFGLLALSFLFLILSNAPAGLRLAAIMTMAEGCTPPEHFPANVGKLVVADLRQPGDGTRFSATEPAPWIGQAIEQLSAATDSTRDLVVYVHGFRTGVADATCTADVLRAALARLPAYAPGAGPDILVFGWPGEFLVWQFTAARDNAVQAGRYLSGVLQALAGRRVMLVAHSLGARVAMVAADSLPKGSTPPLVGLLLIQGAIPAVSIRNWHLKFSLTFPAADLADLRTGKPPRSPIEETKTGSGTFVAAAARAAHLVVTTAGADIPLKNAFALDETFSPSDRNRPWVPPQIGEFADDAFDVRAVGSPFPTGKIYRMYEQVLPDPAKRYDRHPGQIDAHIPSLRPTDPSRVVSRSEWVFEFHVPHPSYHEIRLDRGRWWRLLYDWHGVMNDAAMRHRILSESWAVFSGQAN